MKCRCLTCNEEATTRVYSKYEPEEITNNYCDECAKFFVSRVWKKEPINSKKESDQI